MHHSIDSSFANLKESYFPSSVEWYMERSALFHDIDLTHSSNHDMIADKGELNIPGELTTGSSSTYNYMCCNNEKGGTRNDSPGNWTAYVHIKKSFNAGHPFYSNDYDIQYWLFYPWNGVRSFTNIGVHEGDWEQVTIKVDGITGEIKKVYFGAHGSEGRWVAKEHLQYSPEGYLAVYPSLYGHANYHYAERGIERPTSYSNLAEDLGAADDYTSAEGYTNGYEDYYFNSRNNLEFISIEIEEDANGKLIEELERKDWMYFEGFWGSTDDEAPSPRGPVYQQSDHWNTYWKLEKDVADVALDNIKKNHNSTVVIYTGTGTHYRNDRIHKDLGDTWEDRTLIDHGSYPLAHSFRIHSAKQGVKIKILSLSSPSVSIEILIKKDIKDEVVIIDNPTVEMDSEYIKITNANNILAFDMGAILYEYPRYIEVNEDVSNGTDYHWAETELTLSNMLESGTKGMYYSSNSIVLKPGFEARLGSTLDIGIKTRENIFKEYDDRMESIGELSEGHIYDGCPNGRFSEQSRPSQLTEQVEARFPEVILYPNPGDGFLNLIIEMNKEEKIDFTIYDINGKGIYQMTDETILSGNQIFTFDISELKKGMYTLLIQSDKKSIIKRFIKN